MSKRTTSVIGPLLLAGVAAALAGPAAPADATMPTTECVLTYRIDRGDGLDEGQPNGANMRIRDTLWGIGDGTYGLGPGELTLRTRSDGGQRPAAGKVEVIGYRLRIFFSTGGAAPITNRIVAFARHPKDPERAVATGHLRLGPRPQVTWLPCTHPSGYDEDEDSYTPDVIGYGPGCLAPYRSEGMIECDGMFCSAGGLVDGDNPQADTWEQALEPLVLSPDLDRFQMDFMLVPNRMPSRTYINLGGRLVSSHCR